MIDKIRLSDDTELSKSVPQDYLERLEKNIPASLLPMISDYVRVFLEHIEAPKQEIDRISESIHKRRLNEMFSLVDGYSVKKTRALARKEGRAEGKAEGRAEGRAEERIELAKNLLDVLDVDTIAKKCKMTIEEVEALKEAN